jgi:NAD(P)-dependent dehydrogenase (short-subunit alcohol dehydrogenase family)
MQEFADRVAVVTGAASGIGFALAQALCEEKMKVVLADVREDDLGLAVARLAQAGGTAIGVPCDVSDAAQVVHLRERALEEFGEVQLLCNNAGVIGPAGPVWTLSTAEWDKVMGINLNGVIHGLRAFVPSMLEQGCECHVVNTASVAGLLPGDGAYGVTKHAVIALSEATYSSLKAAGAEVGVSVLVPGLTATAIVERSGPEEVEQEGFRRQWLAQADLGHFQRPSLVAAKALDCIRKGSFWIVPNERYRPASVQRVTDAFEAANPRPLDELLPGFPGAGW